LKRELLHNHPTRYKKFLQKYEDTFPDYPLYDVDIYKWLDKDLKVTCKEHGVVGTVYHGSLFTKAVTPCKQCNEAIRVSKKLLKVGDFIHKCKSVHGDKYDYTEITSLNGVREIIQVFCNTCKDYFPIVADHHQHGNGCQICAQKQRILTLKKGDHIRVDRFYQLGDIEFLPEEGRRLKYFSGDLVNGNLVLGRGLSREGVEGYFIECKCKNKIYFMKSSNQIHKSSCGCVKQDKINETRYKDFLLRMEERNYPTEHVTREDFNKKFVKVFCEEHGMQPLGTRTLYKKAHFCSKCSAKLAGERQRLTNEEVDAELKAKGVLYTRIDDYVNNNTPIRFLCPVTNKPFPIAYSNVRLGKGCPCCKANGYKSHLAGSIYISIWLNTLTGEPSFLKVGITNLGAITRLENQSRNSKDYEGIILDEYHFENGETPPAIEAMLKPLFDRVTVDREKFSDGWTECYSHADYHKIKDILQQEYQKSLHGM
jgi:hypothetical protein